MHEVVAIIDYIVLGSIVIVPWLFGVFGMSCVVLVWLENRDKS